MCNAGFDDQLRLYRPDNFLHGEYVLGNLDDWASHPSKVVSVFVRSDVPYPCVRQALQGLVFTESFDVVLHFSRELLNGIRRHNPSSTRIPNTASQKFACRNWRWRRGSSHRV